MERKLQLQEEAGVLFHPRMAPPGSMNGRLPSPARKPKATNARRVAPHVRRRVETGFLRLIRMDPVQVEPVITDSPRQVELAPSLGMGEDEADQPAECSQGGK